MKTKLRERGQKPFRRLLSFMMALVFAVSLLPVNALADEDVGVVPAEGESTSCVVTVTAKDGDGNLLNGASVKVGSTTATTNSDGQAQVTVDQGKNADVTVTKDGYFKDSGKVNISGDTASFAASLDKEVTYTGTVLLTQDQGNPTEGSPASYPVNAVLGDEKIKAEQVGSTNQQKLTLRKGKTYTVTIEPKTGAPKNAYEEKTIEITLNENKTATGDAWKLALKKYTLNLGEGVTVIKNEHNQNIYYGNQVVTLAFEKKDSQLTGLKINGENYFENVTTNQLNIT
ncbi:Ig-like domain-containing protein, partial [Butyricicoccus sp.]|uniref:Ig-like domain-containing protein n=1 Tax=Butyricicoccus sp. TaxID=2049021 RepID=UPI003F17BD85